MNDVKSSYNSADFARMRKTIGFTQKEIAEFLQIPIGTVATWERRKSKLSGSGQFICRQLDREIMPYAEAVVAAQQKVLEVQALIRSLCFSDLL